MTHDIILTMTVGLYEVELEPVESIFCRLRSAFLSTTISISFLFTVQFVRDLCENYAIRDKESQNTLPPRHCVPTPVLETFKLLKRLHLLNGRSNNTNFNIATFEKSIILRNILDSERSEKTCWFYNDVHIFLFL